MEPAIPVDRARRFAVDSAYALAIMLAVMSWAGATSHGLYVRETTSWATQAIAQDWFDLVIASPLIAATAFLARRDSKAAQLLLAGAQLFAVYTLTIYCFAIQINAFFLVYCAAFGLAIYGLIASVAQLVPQLPAWRGELAPRRIIGGFLVGIGCVFGALWLAQLVPAIVRDRPPAELVANGLATNPVHVLDLSFVLPLLVVAGVAVVRHRAIAKVLAPVLLAFGTLMASSIAWLAIVEGPMTVIVAMSAVATASAVLFVAAVRSLGR